MIGTERHESRRIDNQLRGRSGRQGDPGKSQFFVALDDDIMRLFGGDRIASLMTRFNMPEDVPLTHPLVSKAIQNAQIKVEGHYFDSRKYVVEYDDVLNKQREIVYEQRRAVVKADKKTDELKVQTLERIQNAIGSLVTTASETASFEEAEDVNATIIKEFVTIVPFDDHSQMHLVEQLRQYHTNEEKTEFLTKIASDVYKKREEMMGDEVARMMEKYVALQVIDNLWMDHLDAIDNLREGVRLRGYAQKDPLVEYKNEAYKMFEQLIWNIEDQIVHRIYKIQVQSQEGHEGHDHGPIGPVSVDLSAAVANTPESEVSEDVIQKKAAKARSTKAKISTPVAGTATPASNKKLGRNDPCWCGSGKKYKKCHYPN